MHMTNFDYVSNIETLHDLCTFCQGAEATMESDHDACALNCKPPVTPVIES